MIQIDLVFADILFKNEYANFEQRPKNGLNMLWIEIIYCNYPTQVTNGKNSVVANFQHNKSMTNTSKQKPFPVINLLNI